MNTEELELGLESSLIKKFGLRAIFWSPIEAAATEIVRTLDAIVLTRKGRVLPLPTAFLSTVLAWVLYVPVHEFLHALGCVAAGGRVTEIALSPWFGGKLLASVFPFVRVAEGYAGRLSGFDTGGSDLVLVVTDLTPYLLTIVAAYPALRWACRRRSALMFGVGFVLIAAPAIGILGDLYETGSVIVGRILLPFSGPQSEAAIASLRHDDLFRLLSEFPGRFPRDGWFWGTMIGLAATIGWIVGAAILAASRWVVILPVPGIGNGHPPPPPGLRNPDPPGNPPGGNAG